MPKTAKNWILTTLRWIATLGNIGLFLNAASNLTTESRSNRAFGSGLQSPPDLHPGMIVWMILSFLNLVVVWWSPIRELSNFLSLKMHRLALEEQRKIDELEIIELKNPK